MIENWTWQIPFSLIAGLAGFAALLVPIVLLQYVRYGRLSPARLLGAAALSVYAVALVAYTLLPLPDASTCQGVTGRAVQPVPFGTIPDIAHLVATHGAGSSVVLFALAQPALNIALFVPLGVLVRAMGGRGIAVATATGLALSLLIETTQYTGIFGLVDCAYRVADVDDLLTNTLGALLGALLAPVVGGWIPSAAALAALPPQPVTRLRRLLGMAVDGVLLTTAPGALLAAGVLAWVLVDTLLTGGADAPAPAWLATLLVGVSHLVGIALVVVLPALQGSGASPGQRLVGIAPVWDGRRGTPSARLLRASSVAGVYALAIAAAAVLARAGVGLLPGLLDLGRHGLALVAVLVVVLVGRRGLSGIVSGAELVDRRAVRPPRGRAAGADS